MIVLRGTAMPNVESLLREHVTLNVDCIDRIYLNGYVPLLQRPQNLWWFLHEHRGQPIISPVLLKRLSDTFIAAIHGFAQRNAVPLVHFSPHASKEAVARQHLARFDADEGVVMIGVAQEKVSGFRVFQKGPRRRHRTPPGGKAPCFAFYRGDVFVNQYYFYILDHDFGLSFIKFSSYVPFGVRVWLNGHEWAKHQLERQHVTFESLDNGFLSCAKPDKLQIVCDQLGPEHIDNFFRKWLRRLPHPLTRADRRAGFLYQLSILQLEMSLTQVVDRPVHGREFFEEVIRDNLDLGRPDRVQLLFERRVTRRTPGRFLTRVVAAGVQPSVRFQYKHTRVKQYFKLDRAMRTETTFNDTYDFDIGRALNNLPRLRTLGHHINHRLLTLERTAHHCAVASQTVERVVLPTQDEGQRAPALRWGDPRTMALFSALCVFIATPEGFTNRSLRDQVGRRLAPDGDPYGAANMTYDLRRLRLKGLIARVRQTHRYVLTPLGRRVAFFMTKSYVRIVRPILRRTEPRLAPHADDALRRAWRACEHAIDDAVRAARLAA
jgi:hypothetical protein